MEKRIAASFCHLVGQRARMASQVRILSTQREIQINRPPSFKKRLIDLYLICTNWWRACKNTAWLHDCLSDVLIGGAWYIDYKTLYSATSCFLRQNIDSVAHDFGSSSSKNWCFLQVKQFCNATGTAICKWPEDGDAAGAQWWRTASFLLRTDWTYSETEFLVITMTQCRSTVSPFVDQIAPAQEMGWKLCGQIGTL